LYYDFWHSVYITDMRMTRCKLKRTK